MRIVKSGKSHHAKIEAVGGGGNPGTARTGTIAFGGVETPEAEKKTVPLKGSE